MKLSYGLPLAHQPQVNPQTGKNPFSKFKNAVIKAAGVAARTLLYTSLLITPATLFFSRTHAADPPVPSSIVWIGGVDWAKKAVRDHFNSGSVNINNSVMVEDMPMGRLVNLRLKDGQSVIPYITRECIQGMAYSFWPLHGFFHAGGDSLKYEIAYHCSNKYSAIRSRPYVWEYKYGSAFHRDFRWSSIRPSYQTNQSSSWRCPVMSSIGVNSSELLKWFSNGGIIDTVQYKWHGQDLQFCHAWNYGEGNWGKKRQWLGITSAEHQWEGIGFSDVLPQYRHQLQRPLIYPLPEPGGTKTFMGWVLDTVFWKVAPNDSTAPYDMMSRVDSVRFATAVLDSELLFLRFQPLQPGETDAVTVRPGDVFKLPLPERLIPFSDYGNRKGKYVDPWYQLANITTPELDHYTIHGLLIAPFEIVFYQDSTAKFGPWYTRMKGSVVKNLYDKESGMTDTGSVFTIDSLILWRFLKIPKAGDTSHISLGDEYSSQFRVPDSCYGAKCYTGPDGIMNVHYDQLIAGFFYGKDYVTGTVSQPVLHAKLPALRPAGNGRYAVDFQDGTRHEVGIYDMRGREVRTLAAEHGKAMVDLHGLSAGTYMLTTDGPAYATFKAVLLH